MASRDGVFGTLLSFNTDKKELTIEENAIVIEAEPEVELNSYPYDLDDDWDEARFKLAVGERVYGTLVDGVIRGLYLR